MKKNKFIALSLIFAAVCAVMGALRISTGYDSRGLPMPGNIYAHTLIVLYIIAFISLLVLSLSFRGGDCFLQDFSPQKKRFYRFGAVLMMAAGVLHILSSFGGALSPTDLLIGVFAAFSAVSVLHLRHTGKHSASPAIWSLTPVCFCTVWLVLCYRDHAADPLLWDYGQSLIAIAAITAAFYYQAGIYFGRPFYRRAMFFTALSVFSSIAALPAAGALGRAVCLCACAVIQCVNMAQLQIKSTKQQTL